MNGEHSDFDLAVSRLLETLAGAGSAAGAASRDVIEITGALTRFIAARFPRSRDADDIASEAVARFVEAAKSGRVSAQGRPAAYLTRIAQNAAIDRLRQEGRVEAFAEVPTGEVADEEAIVRLLDSDATCQRVSEGIDAANRAGDHTVVLVITHWIDTAQTLSRAPTSREVGHRADVSHATVSEAMRRFRRYLPDAGPNP
jgi:DNA-directed RNA polymerase specialized sigma24 family protein